jgi:hypothetical protein
VTDKRIAPETFLESTPRPKELAISKFKPTSPKTETASVVIKPRLNHFRQRGGLIDSARFSDVSDLIGKDTPEAPF